MLENNGSYYSCMMLAYIMYRQNKKFPMWDAIYIVDTLENNAHYYSYVLIAPIMEKANFCSSLVIAKKKKGS